MNKNKGAFTLVELIIVVAILAVLSGIGVISFSGYLITVRDSTRVVVFEDIESSMSTFIMKNGFYPEPTNPVNVSYSGGLVWKQGIFGNEIANIIGFGEDTLDPLTKNPYTYSLGNSRKSFSIAGVFEKKVVNSNDTFKKVALIRGNYNGEIATVKTGSTTYVLALPSIVSTDVGYTNLLDIINDNKLVYNNFKNLPSSYSGTKYNLNANINFLPNNIVVFSGSINDLKKGINQIELLKNIYTAYTGSILGETISVNNLDYTDLFSATPSSKIQILACDTVNFKLKYPVKCK